MRTFKLPDLWFKLAKGTSLEKYNWDEIAQILLEHKLIRLHAGPGEDALTRYSLVYPSENKSRLPIKDEIIEVLKTELPVKYGRR